MTTAILLSGGMDSISLAYWLRPEIAVTVDYGQRAAAAEFRASEAVAEVLGMRHLKITLSAGGLGSGSMVGTATLAIAPRPEWWPYRNQLLVTAAAAAAITYGARRLLIGTLKTDGHHADGRKEFVQQLSALLEMQEGGMTLEAPAIDMSAEELVRRSGIPMEVLAWSHSCHVSDYACGDCGGCRKHYRTMSAIGVTPY
jgi:7-cyano-7-deazaguanine synthase